MKFGALIPIRLASERLPGKALKLICGRPVVHHLLDRVTASHLIAAPEDVVVCTTKENSDDPLVVAVEDYGCAIFRGSTDDIIKRFHDAIDHFGFDAVAQIDGDDPLAPTEYIDLTLQALLDEAGLDIVSTEGLPLGCNVKSFTRAAVEKVYAAYATTRNDTGFAYFFTKSGLCEHRTIRPTSGTHIHDGARLTLDYEEDFLLFERVFEALYRDGEVFSLDETVAFLNRNPETVAINQSLNEEYWARTAEKVALTYRDPDGTVREILQQ